MVPFQTNRIHYIHLPFFGCFNNQMLFWKGSKEPFVSCSTNLPSGQLAAGFFSDFKPSPTPRLWTWRFGGGFLNILMILTPKPWGRWSSLTKPWGNLNFIPFQPGNGRWSENKLTFAYVSFMACVWNHQVVGEVFHKSSLSSFHLCRGCDPKMSPPFRLNKLVG